MSRSVSVRLTPGEAQMILQALETDHDIYLRCARDAAADGNVTLAAALGDTADRIGAFRCRFRRALDQPGARH